MRATSFLVAAVSAYSCYLCSSFSHVSRVANAFLLLIQFAASVASAARIQVLIGANKTANASMIFIPQEIRAFAGDTVVFNCEYPFTLCPWSPPPSGTDRTLS